MLTRVRCLVSHILKITSMGNHQKVLIHDEIHDHVRVCVCLFVYACGCMWVWVWVYVGV